MMQTREMMICHHQKIKKRVENRRMGMIQQHSFIKRASVGRERRQLSGKNNVRPLRKEASQRNRKASAATATASRVKKNAGSGVSSKGKRKLSEGEEEQAQTIAAKKTYRYECSTVGCTNIAVNGGVCVRHGANHLRGI
jgi:hypothetical protein